MGTRSGSSTISSAESHRADGLVVEGRRRSLRKGLLTCGQPFRRASTISSLCCFVILRLQSQNAVQAFVESPLRIAGRIQPSKSSGEFPSRSPPDLLLLVGRKSDNPSPINGEDDEQQEVSTQPLQQQPQKRVLSLGEVNVLYGQTSSLVYDPVQERYVKRSNSFMSNTAGASSSSSSSIALPEHEHEHQAQEYSYRHSLVYFFRHTLLPRLTVAFLPAGGVTPNYYRFTQWRIVQRWVSANLHVIGTQSLLLGLGISTTRSQLGALSAALNWVLKDALGKVVRMFWASRMGQRFDSDAKRWRFRASLVYAAGNGLEIVTALHPHWFLIWATLANCCKQVSMLTSSSTRTALYNSFRDGTRENIGDITAKGEAQIAVVDLIGIATGVAMSRAVGSSVKSVALLYGVLQSLEIVCMYRQLRCVCYRVLNFERLVYIIQKFTKSYTSQKNDSTNAANCSTSSIPTPSELSIQERLFLPPDNLSRRAIAYGSLGRAKLSPIELERLLEICAKERFLLVVGANVKHPKRDDRWPWNKKHESSSLQERMAQLQENCHIVLHENANNLDIVKSTLALTFLRQKLAASADILDPEKIRSSDCFEMIATSLQQANACFPSLLRQLTHQGWESPARFMFGRVFMRAQWPLEDKIAKKKT